MIHHYSRTELAALLRLVVRSPKLPEEEKVFKRLVKKLHDEIDVYTQEALDRREEAKRCRERNKHYAQEAAERGES